MFKISIFTTVKKLKFKISTGLSIAILLASLLPALHSLSHDTSFADDDLNSVHYSSIDAKFGCDLCFFHFSTSTSPKICSYSLYMPFKGEVYYVSFKDKVSISQNRLFHLRAPPALIG